jgi:hypothetical protein
MTMKYKPARNTTKMKRAREMIASIYHIPESQIRTDTAGVMTMYANLHGLGFEWVADEQEWMHPDAKNPLQANIFSFVVGSATHPAEDAALIIIEALEKQGYKLGACAVINDINNPDETIVRVEVIK